MSPELCNWDSATYLIFSDNVFGQFIYFSHLPALIASLFLGFWLYKYRRNLFTSILLVITILFSFWSFFDLIVWATEKSEFTMFFWSTINTLEVLIYMLFVYLVYVFIEEKDISNSKKIILFSIALPSVVLMATPLNLVGYNLSNCDRDAVEGVLGYYNYGAEIIYILWIFVYSIKAYIKSSILERKKVVVFVSGVIIFLLAFSFGNIVGSFTEDWVIGQIGLAGMPIFIGFLAYSIVKYQLFNLKLLATQALVVSMGGLLSSILFIRNIENVRYAIFAMLALFFFASRALIKSVKEVDMQKEKLQIAYSAQADLLHFVSHQVKGFLTNTKAALSMVLEGDYGPVTKPVHDIVEQTFISEDRGVTMVQSFLNAARIDDGAVEYTMKEFDLKKLIEDVVRGEANPIKEKGLTLSFSAAADSVYIMNGDAIKFREVIFNLIDNAIKYTPKGAIEAHLERLGNTLRFSVKDNGVGIPEYDREKIFTKYGHGRDSKKVNVHSNGLGLYLVKNVVEKHNGKAWFTSETEGENKGTTFFVEVPGV